MIFDFFLGELETPIFFNPGSGPSTLVPNLHSQPQLQNPSIVFFLFVHTRMRPLLDHGVNR